MTDTENALEAAPLVPVEGNFTDLGRATKRAPAWVLEPVLPEGLVILAGPPKEAFKSTVTMAFACTVTDHPNKALPSTWVKRGDGPVLVLSHEADAGELRFIVEEGLGVTLRQDESILVADRPEDFRLDEAEGLAELLKWLDARKPILTIIDPIANFHNLEEKDAGQMIQLLAPLRRWAKAEHACILIVHHTRKLDEERRLRASDVRGTSALFGLADGLILLSPTSTEYELHFDVKPKRGPHFEETVALGIWGGRATAGQVALKGIDKLLIKAVQLGYTRVEDAAKYINIDTGMALKKLQALEQRGLLTLKKGKVKLHAG